jgi:hypothetical protein
MLVAPPSDMGAPLYFLGPVKMVVLPMEALGCSSWASPFRSINDDAVHQLLVNTSPLAKVAREFLGNIWMFQTQLLQQLRIGVSPSVLESFFPQNPGLFLSFAILCARTVDPPLWRAQNMILTLSADKPTSSTEVVSGHS